MSALHKCNVAPGPRTVSINMHENCMVLPVVLMHPQQCLQLSGVSRKFRSAYA